MRFVLIIVSMVGCTIAGNVILKLGAVAGHDLDEEITDLISFRTIRHLANWYIFLALSIGWEILELYLPYEFAVEETANKVSDLIVNTIGFWLGIKLRNEEIEN